MLKKPILRRKTFQFTINHIKFLVQIAVDAPPHGNDEVMLLSPGQNQKKMKITDHIYCAEKQVLAASRTYLQDAEVQIDTSSNGDMCVFNTIFVVRIQDTYHREQIETVAAYITRICFVSKLLTTKMHRNQRIYGQNVLLTFLLHKKKVDEDKCDSFLRKLRARLDHPDTYKCEI